MASASKWEALKRYSDLAQQYAGSPAATEAMTQKTELAKDSAVKSEVAALKVLEANRSLITSPKETVRNRAVTNMKKLIDEHPDSEAAKVAALIVSGR